MKYRKSFWFTIKKYRGFKKIIPTVKAAVKYLIINHPPVIVSHITNDCVNINVQLITSKAFDLV